MVANSTGCSIFVGCILSKDRGDCLLWSCSRNGIGVIHTHFQGGPRRSWTSKK